MSKLTSARFNAVLVSSMLCSTILVGSALVASATVAPTADKLHLQLNIPRQFHRIPIACCAQPNKKMAGWKLGNAEGSPTITVVEEGIPKGTNIRQYIADSALVPGESAPAVSYGSNCGNAVAFSRSNITLANKEFTTIQVIIVGTVRAVTATYFYPSKERPDEAVLKTLRQMCLTDPK
jgi:hypothetical protein